MNAWRMFAPTTPPSEVPGVPQRNWLEFADAGSVLGDSTVPPTMVVFSDYQCPWCKRVDDILQDVLSTTDRPVKVLYRHWPLTAIHPHAREAALASICADRAGRFHAMHRELFRLKDSLGLIPATDFAVRAGIVEIDAFDRCTKSADAQLVLKRDSLAASRLQVGGTPTILAGGKRFNGSIPKAQIEKLLGVAIGTRPAAIFGRR